MVYLAVVFSHDADSMNASEYDRHFQQLVDDLGLNGELFRQVVLWALVEERIKSLTPPRAELDAMKVAKDGKAIYWAFVEAKTHRPWQSECILRYWDRVCKDSQRYQRKAIRLEDRLRLFFTSPHVCRQCKKGPPEVKLELDHIEPVARGGAGGVANLQFLCSHHNQAKGARLAREDFFARYLC